MQTWQKNAKEFNSLFKTHLVVVFGRRHGSFLPLRCYDVIQLLLMTFYVIKHQPCRSGFFRVIVIDGAIIVFIGLPSLEPQQKIKLLKWASLSHPRIEDDAAFWHVTQIAHGPHNRISGTFIQELLLILIGGLRG